MIINMNGAKAPETPSSVLQEKTVTPETLPTVIGPDEGYDGLTQVTVNPDAQLKAENIRSGKTIFGVEGVFEGNGNRTDFEVKYATCIKGILNDYTITDTELKEYFTGGVEYSTFNGMPNIIMPYSILGTLDLSNTYSSSIRPGAIQGIGLEYRYPFTLKLQTLGGSSVSGNEPLGYPVVKCAIKDVVISQVPSSGMLGASFYYCAFFNDLVIPEGYTQIFGSLIYDCYKNRTVGRYDATGMTVVLPSTLTSISVSNAIRFNYNHKGTIVMKAVTPPKLSSTSNIQYCTKIIVPKGSLEAYQTATNWSNFANIMEEATE